MKTVVETVPVIDVKPNPAAATDPTQHATIVTMGSETVVRTVPDDGEWLRAQSEGAGIRSRSDKEAKRILERAFTDGVLPPGSLAAGSIYYQRDAGIEEVLVRIPLGNVVAEIPFTAAREHRLIGRSSLRFR